MQETVRLAEPLREALQPLAAQIREAFVLVSVAKRQDVATSDIDLMVVSNVLGYIDASPAVEGAGARLGRAVNPTIMFRRDLAKRVKDDNAFATRVLAQPKICLTGRECDLRV